MSPPPAADDAAWIVVAAFQEAAVLDETLGRLCARRRNVVVVDDGSTDATAEVALHHPVWLLRHVFNCGQGAALQTGIDFALRAGARAVVTFDADGQHDPDEIERLLAPVEDGTADVALGSRFLGRAVGLPWPRKLVLKLGVIFTWAFSGVRVTDTHNGLRAFTRAAAARVHLTHNRMAHASELIDQIRREGLRFVEVPVTIRYTPGSLAKGQSSWNAVKIAAQLLLGRLIG